MNSIIQSAVSFLAQSDLEMTTHSSGGPVPGLIGLAVAVVVIVAGWKLFTKAGQPGWGILIPIYNLYLMCKIAGRPGWWVILMLIPLVNFIVAIILWIDIAKAFGKGVGFALGLIFLSFIFLPVLPFGDAEYHGAPAT